MEHLKTYEVFTETLNTTSENPKTEDQQMVNEDRKILSYVDFTEK